MISKMNHPPFLFDYGIDDPALNIPEFSPCLARLPLINHILLYLSPVFDEKLCLPGNTNNLNLRLNGSHGNLQSPMEKYSSLQCEWLITVPEGKVVEISFERFQLLPRDQWKACSGSSLEVYDGKYGSGDSMGTYCDIVVPEPMTSSSRYMQVRFTSTTRYFRLYPGFQATFSAVDQQSKLGLINIDS